MMDALTWMGSVGSTGMATVTRDEFSRMVAQHQAAVCAVAYSTLGDRAVSEEIAQEAFLLAWRKLPELDEPPKLPAWFCGIARNLARNSRRSAWRSAGSDALDAAPSEDASPLDEVLGAESEKVAWRALESLPESYREPLVLYYGCDQSVRQVAAALDITEANAKQRLSRGRAKLEQGAQDRVARTLKENAPTATFTASVLAAIASMPLPAHAASSATVPAKSAGLLKLALGAGAAAAVVALGIGAFSSRGPAADPTPASVSGDASALVTTRGETAPQPSSRPTASAPRSPWLRPRALAPSFASPPPSQQANDADPISPELHARLARKIDLDLKEANVHEVLRLLGQVGGTEIIVTGDIDSDVSFRLRATSVIEALDVTLEQAGAVWREVPRVRIVGGPGPAGPPIDGSPITMELVDVPFAAVAEAFSSALHMPVVVADGLQVPPVTVHLVGVPAGEALASVVRHAGLRYEVADVIEVRPAEDDDAEE